MTCGHFTKRPYTKTSVCGIADIRQNNEADFTLNLRNANSEPNLRIPGPVPLPDDVLEIAGRQMINHRGPEYARMLETMSDNLRTMLMTKNDVYFITSSGTGAMETAVFIPLAQEAILAFRPRVFLATACMLSAIFSHTL